MWLKLEGENIIGHSYDNLTDGTGYDVHIENQVLVDLSNGQYKFKWDGSRLVLMSTAEIYSHPIVIRQQIEAKLKEIYEKEDAKASINKWNEVKKDVSLSAAEKAVIDEKIAELNAKANKQLEV